MPSKEQYDELINSEYTTTTWTTVNGKKGYLITSKSNENSIFLPAAGWRGNSSLNYAGSDGYYWSRSLNEGGPYGAWGLDFGLNLIYSGYLYRCNGLSVRPVRLLE